MTSQNLKKMKKIILLIFILFCIPMLGQSNDKLSFDKLRQHLTSYLIEKGDIQKSEADLFIKGEKIIRISGFHNKLDKGEVKIGVYSFFLTRTMARGYFVIVDNNVCTILDITTREGLEKSIKDVLDFCEKYEYCVDISKTYVNRLIEVYYNYNKWPDQRRDLNCEEGRGINDTKKLP